MLAWHKCVNGFRDLFFLWTSRIPGTFSSVFSQKILWNPKTKSLSKIRGLELINYTKIISKTGYVQSK
jgi:hypothetical protein